MSRRGASILWLLVAAALWNGIFELYVSRGVREYLQREAEYALQRGPEPSMSFVMGRARRDGIIAASGWAAVVLLGGWLTVFRVRRDA